MSQDRLNADNVPPGLAVLLALADAWAIGDDTDRSMKIESSNQATLQALVEAVDAVDATALYGWLTGPESADGKRSAEYIAISCITMAADEARVTLRGSSGFDS